MEFSESDEKNFVDSLLKDAPVRHYKKGEFIYHQGDTPEGLYHVDDGLVGLTMNTASGQESLIRLFKKGQFLGHRTFFSDETYHGSSRCLENTTISFSPKSRVNKAFEKEPRAYFFLARALAKELRRAEVRSLLVSEGDVRERVAATLMIFKSLNPEHKWTRSEIANFCASRTPTVITALGVLEKQGIIKQEGRQIEIVKEEALRSLIDSQTL